ncbi:MAG: thioredoxin family protein [Limisphaerales bacterium]
MQRILSLLVLISTGLLSGCDDSKLTVDMNNTVTDTNAPPVDLASAVARARVEGKMLLLEFGDSDACPPCILFQQKVFSTSAFVDYQKSNLIFLRLDYPLNHPLRVDTAATNAILAQQFDINPFPTFIALDGNGKESWRMPQSGDSGIDVALFNPTNFIRLLESVRQKEK